MQTDFHPCSKDLILVGGGHAHALLLLKWAMNPLPGARVTLINPDTSSPYTGMLPGFVAGHYELNDMNIDLVRLSHYAGVRFVKDEVTNFNLDKQCVYRKNGPDIYYDVLSINIGITLAMEKLTGFVEFGTPAKPLGLFAQRWRNYLTTVKKQQITPRIVVLGGGVGGVELAMAMKYHLQRFVQGNSSVTIVEQENSILNELAVAARSKLKRHLDRLGIEVLTNTKALQIHAEAIELSTGGKLACNFVVGTAGASSISWLKGTGLSCNKGFIIVDKYLKSPGNASVFAVGDCATIEEKTLPKAGVYAIREAPILYHNLKATLAGKKLVPFRPQNDFLKLISTGQKNAVGMKRGISFEGRSIWALKDYIDQKFMRKFDLKISTPEVRILHEAALGSNEILQESKVLCGGCGAKVSQSSLHTALRGFKPSTPELNPDAVELNLGSDSLMVSTDHLRTFIDDHALFARIVALHTMSDLWAKGVKPQYALASITVPRMSERLQAETLREIMEVSTRTFEENGASIVGGHTTQGAELTIGFTVIGNLNASCTSHVGAQAGHLVFLTKPIGTGVILAGLMQGKVTGEILYGCLDIMTQSSGTASEILTPLVSTMTDVTGFGLAGHLHNILASSNFGATLTASSIPIIKGAKKLSAAGVRSTLWKANASIPLTADHTTEEINILFDPQTSGGLMGTISKSNFETVQSIAKERGVEIYPIGEITEGSPEIRIVP